MELSSPHPTESRLAELKDSVDKNAPLLLLCLIAQLHGVAVDMDSLTHQLALSSETPQNYDFLRLAASKLGLRASQETVAVTHHVSL